MHWSTTVLPDNSDHFVMNVYDFFTKLGGVFAPNDGTCHMNGLQPNDDNSTFDYPDYDIQVST